MAIQKTYSMIKPDGVRNGHIGEIVNRFERAGLVVERMELGMVTPEQAAANYKEQRHTLSPLSPPRSSSCGYSFGLSLPLCPLTLGAGGFHWGRASKKHV